MNSTVTDPREVVVGFSRSAYSQAVHFADGYVFEFSGYAFDAETFAKECRRDSRAEVRPGRFTLTMCQPGGHAETITPDGFGYDNRDEAEVAAQRLAGYLGMGREAIWSTFGRAEEYWEPSY